MKESNIFIVRSSCTVVQSLKEYIWLLYGMAWAVDKCKVKTSQVEGPVGLITVKFLGHHEIL